eukprot:TRINITY_DN325_c0_g1_i1.p2 TRINITY_DN325_c0_g1~~TRINITY_DN325_c0_g1_i1.p2  ORF type:complete len:269 (-),score=-0.04 TRINITY_DN325_c0_g1_i1:83-889(-)
MLILDLVYYNNQCQIYIVLDQILLLYQFNMLKYATIQLCNLYIWVQWNFSSNLDKVLHCTFQKMQVESKQQQKGVKIKFLESSPFCLELQFQQLWTVETRLSKHRLSQPFIVRNNTSGDLTNEDLSSLVKSLQQIVIILILIRTIYYNSRNPEKFSLDQSLDQMSIRSNFLISEVLLEKLEPKMLDIRGSTVLAIIPKDILIRSYMQKPILVVSSSQGGGYFSPGFGGQKKISFMLYENVVDGVTCLSKGLICLQVVDQVGFTVQTYV